jgi:hypothetical protein
LLWGKLWVFDLRDWHLAFFVQSPSFISFRPCNVTGRFSFFPIERKNRKHTFTISYGRAPGDWNKQAYQPKRIRPLSKYTTSLTFCTIRSNNRFFWSISVNI